MAPEVLGQLYYDHTSDYYQVGLMLFHLLNGECFKLGNKLEDAL